MNYRLGYVGSINGTKVTDEDAIELFKGRVAKEDVEVDYLRSVFRKVNYKDDRYLIFDSENEIKVYKILPLVINDDVFIWEERMFGRNIRALWCQVKTNLNVRFNITYYMNTTDVQINVMYNKGNVGVVWLRNCPTNKDILDEMKIWLEEFKAEIKDTSLN